MTKAATSLALAPVEATRFLPRRTRSGHTRPEVWGAKTTDGTWAFDREDEPGTPWTVTHLPTMTVVDCYVSTLTDCRAYVASGQAEADLELLQAHGLGEHGKQRNPACGRC